MATAGSPTFTPEEAAARVEAASRARRRPWRWSIAPAISGFLALAYFLGVLLPFYVYERAHGTWVCGQSDSSNCFPDGALESTGHWFSNIPVLAGVGQSFVFFWPVFVIPLVAVNAWRVRWRRAGGDGTPWTSVVGLALALAVGIVAITPIGRRLFGFVMD